MALAQSASKGKNMPGEMFTAYISPGTIHLSLDYRKSARSKKTTADRLRG
jgi:hypothetical protein